MINASNANTHFDHSRMFLNLSIDQVEKDWISRAIKEIKQAQKIQNVSVVREAVSHQVQKLFSFAPEQIIRLVNLLDQSLKQVDSDHVINEYLFRDVASLIVERGLDPFKPMLIASNDGQITLKVARELIIHDQPPLEVIKDLHICGFDESKLTAKQDLITIAKLLAKHGIIVTDIIDETTAEGQQGLIEIAKLAAQRDGEDTTDNIHLYGIDVSTPAGQQAMIEIAKLAVNECGGIISRHIENYGIDPNTLEGKKALIEIAKTAAQKDGWRTSYYIKNYGIEAITPDGQKALIEIAKLAAIQNGSDTSRYIKDYSIDPTTPEGQQALIEIAILAAQHSPEGISAYIHLYGINRSTSEGQKALIEIAKIAAQKSGWSVSHYFYNYGIDTTPFEGQQAVIEIAKLAARQNNTSTSIFIQNYGINRNTPEGQRGLIEIAKVAAAQPLGGFSDFIRDYRIDNSTLEGQKGLIAIAKLVAQQIAYETYNHISNYGIDPSLAESEDLIPFILNCYLKQLPSFSQKTEAYDNPNFVNAFNKLAEGDLQGALKEGLKGYQIIFDWQEKDLLWIPQWLENNTEPLIKKRFLEWLFVAASLCARDKEGIEIFKTQQETFKEIAMQTPHLRELLAKQLFLFSKLNNIEGFQKLKQASENIIHVKLVCLVLANFPREGEAIYLKALDILKAEQMFRDGKNQKLLLETLIEINQSLLERTQKSVLIATLFGLPAEQRQQSLWLVSEILAFNGEAYLTQFSTLADLQKTLSKLST